MHVTTCNLFRLGVVYTQYICNPMCVAWYYLQPLLIGCRIRPIYCNPMCTACYYLQPLLIGCRTLAQYICNPMLCCMLLFATPFNWGSYPPNIFANRCVRHVTICNPFDRVSYTPMTCGIRCALHVTICNSILIFFQGFAYKCSWSQCWVRYSSGVPILKTMGSKTWVNHFRTAVPFWGQPTWTFSGSSPNGTTVLKGLKKTTWIACHEKKLLKARMGYFFQY